MRPDPTLHTAALAALEAPLNRALSLSPRSTTELTQLQDCVFALHCSAPVLDVFLHTGEQGIRQLNEFIHEDARLSPPRLEMEDFYADVQELGLRVDRLQSRTERLRQQLHLHLQKQGN